jgi:hypothetical protein
MSREATCAGTRGSRRSAFGTVRGPRFDAEHVRSLGLSGLPDTLPNVRLIRLDVLPANPRADVAL